jgi:hypothetical protein
VKSSGASGETARRFRLKDATAKVRRPRQSSAVKVELCFEGSIVRGVLGLAAAVRRGRRGGTPKDANGLGWRW